MLDVGRRIGLGGGCAGAADDGRRSGARGGAEEGETVPAALRAASAALSLGSGGRLRLGGGGGWLNTGRACGTPAGD
jgi:hypothetical protein